MNIIKDMLDFSKWKNKYRKNYPQFLIIHHALAKFATIEDINRWHVKRNMYGCAYHFYIRKDGTIYEGRKIEWNGSHCKEDGMNNKSIGICLEGCYEQYGNQTETSVPREQMRALNELVWNLMVEYKIPVEKVKRHGDHAKYKKCPGNFFPWNDFICGLNTVTGGSAVLPKVEPWQNDGINYLANNGMIDEPETWKGKINEPMPVWAITTLLMKMHKNIKKGAD